MAAKESAQAGLAEIKDAILELLSSRGYGLTNGEISVELGLESDQGGKQKNYLAWSVLGLLMKEGRVQRTTHQRPGEHTPREVYRIIT